MGFHASKKHDNGSATCGGAAALRAWGSWIPTLRKVREGWGTQVLSLGK